MTKYYNTGSTAVTSKRECQFSIQPSHFCFGVLFCSYRLSILFQICLESKSKSEKCIRIYIWYCEIIYKAFIQNTECSELKVWP